MCPTYDFHCEECESPFEVIRSMSNYQGRERCPKCSTVSSQRIFSSKIQFIGTKVEDREFNPGLGIITKSARHRKDEAKARGLEEVGTERPEKMHKHFDDQRAATAKKRWDDV